jgi:hypothetical protein
VNANAYGAAISVMSLGGGAAADMSISGAVADSNPTYFCMQTAPYTCYPSFSIATTNMSGGGSTEGDLLYGFTIPDQGGYDLNGNLLSVTDSIMGHSGSTVADPRSWEAKWLFHREKVTLITTGNRA